ncbi:MAG: glycine cleavage system aminomethyltransferase GcvT [Methanobacteriota archaeon]|nr:MAG: glycine cleavage system aminomethyltransferase GcvT [Euryarchaeota archaeon]
MDVDDGELSRTSCYNEHVLAGANMVDFHGYELPMWYSSIMEEHLATRSKVGLFDVSHMGFFCFHGDNVREWFESIATQKVTSIVVGKCGYTHFLDFDGNIIDDMIFAVTNDEEMSMFRKNWNNTGSPVILGVPNASMIDVMMDWYTSLLPSDGSITIENLSDEYSILALQGPNSKDVLISVLGVENNVNRFSCQAIKENELGISGWIQGTGYTGELGFEIFIPNSQAPVIWSEILKDKSDSGVTPVGLGARDTLRLEMGYLLSGQDFYWPGLGDSDSNTNLIRNSLETQIPFGLELEHDFLGKENMIGKQSNEHLFGLEYLERGPAPRPGHSVYSDSSINSESLGIITSGAPSPSLGNKGIALAYLNQVKIGDIVYVAASKRKLIKAKIVVPPFI